MSTNAVSRERLASLGIAADIGHSYISAGDDCRPPSDVLHEDVHGRTIYMVASRPPYSEEVQRVPLILHTPCTQVILEILGHLRWCRLQIIFVSVFLDAREQET